MKFRAASFAFGFIAAACITSAVAFVFQKRLRDRHADCPLDSTEVFLRSMANLSDAERSSIEGMFAKFVNDGTYPTLTSRMGAFKAAARQYDGRSDERALQEMVAEIIVQYHVSFEAAASDRDLMFRLGPEIEAAKKEVDSFLSKNPAIHKIVEERQANQPAEPTALVPAETGSRGRRLSLAARLAHG